MGNRYSKIQKQNRREIVLLKGFPCMYGKCSFCNYIQDNSTDTNEISTINKEALRQVTGEFGVLEIINSASVFELPQTTLEEIRTVVERCSIQILYFEIYYGYKHRLSEITSFFPNIEIRFRMGLETFDNDFRINTYNKPFRIKEETYATLAQSVYAICLLVCVKGQTKAMIERDIELGLNYFRSITINVFVNNDTRVERDDELYVWFVKKYAFLCNHPQVELLLDNKDLGVFEQ